MAKRQVNTDNHKIPEHENTADIWRVLQRLFTLLWHHAVLKQTPGSPQRQWSQNTARRLNFLETCVCQQ